MNTDIIVAPRVSFIVLAFNQEAFIKAAIDGALAQDYPDLEVILSDDGSSDRTWALIQDAVATYRGPHTVIANRTAQNRGLLAHIYDAVEKSSGELIVVAAGDDVSLPMRTAVLVGRWRETGADALFSDWDVIDKTGLVTGQGGGNGLGTVARWLPDGRFTAITGATAAYAREVFTAIALPPFPIFTEDLFLSLVLRLRSRRVEHVPNRLVQYRTHSGSLINIPVALTNIAPTERKLEHLTATAIPMISYIGRIARDSHGVESWFGSPVAINQSRLQHDLRHVHFRAAWIDAPIHRRLLELARQRSTANLRWLLPRLGGLATLRLQRRLTAWWRRSK